MKSAHNEHLFIEAIKAGYFRIDSEGRVWRLAIKSRTKRFIKIQEREIKTISSNGYNQIAFHKNGKQYHCLAHRIVWIYFNGEIPDNLEINHKNGIKRDNRLCNLELVTCSENHKHAFNNLDRQATKGEKQGNSKLTEGDIKKIRKRYSEGEFQTAIAQDFNISREQISHIVNRKRWAHIT